MITNLPHLPKELKMVYICSMTTCAFATTCWEKDWRLLLLDPDYLRRGLIGNHKYLFEDRLLVINNVRDLTCVKKAADRLVSGDILTRYIVADEIAEEMLLFFELKRSDFRMGSDAGDYVGVNPDWIYYNAIGPLSAIYAGTSDYLLYHTGDVRLDYPVRWIERSMRLMEKNPKIKVANLVWNENFREVKRESYRKSWNFFYAKQGFSDQQFLVKRSVFRQPVYGEIRADSGHYPRGDVFEKRVFSFLKNRNFERMIFRRGSYIHENVE
jgi:hypothetical protein